MASVGAINSSSVSAKDLLASMGNTTVSKVSETQQFENYLKNNSSTQNQSQAADAASTSQVQKTTLNQNQVKREEFSSDRTGSADVSGGKAVLSPEEAEQLSALQEEMRGIIKDTLGIDDETIDAALQAMGIVLTDLFQPEVLQQFILLVGGGEESTDFLTNEDLMNSFIDLLQLLEDFQAENQDMLPLMEKLDTPMLLDEFLQQEGLADEAGSFNEALADAALQEDAAGNLTIASQQAATEEKVVSDYSNGQEEVSVLDASKGASEEIQVVQGSDAESTEDSTDEDASDLFFAQRQDFSEDKAVNTPLFAEQLNPQQVNDGQMVQPQWGGMQRMQQMIDIVNQVSQSIRSQINADTTSVEMQLHPESLGKVFFSVVSKNGVMTANFQVQTEEAKQALESQMLTLRDNLEAKNLKVESVEVHVSDFSFTQSNQAEGQSQEEMAKQSRRKFRYDTEDDESSEEAAKVSAEQVRRQVMRDSGGSIDFTA